MFCDYLSTLKEASYDSEKRVYLVENTEECINFDKYKENYCRNLGQDKDDNYGFLKSVDAIIEKKSKIYFIEFKNTKICTKLIYDVLEKCYDSLLMYFEKTGKNIANSRESFCFALVTNYGDEINTVDSFKSIQQNVERNANKLWQKYERKLKSFYFFEVKIFRPVDFNSFLIKEGICAENAKDKQGVDAST